MGVGPFPSVVGLHHVTMLASDPARARRFYTQVLGFRLVKRTVNYDDPSVYHLYFGDGAGTPGTVVTLFPYERIKAARRGVGEIAECALAVPSGMLGEWTRRLKAAGIKAERSEIMGDGRLHFKDPDGLPLSLVESLHTELDYHPWLRGPVESTMAVMRLHSVSLHLPDIENTARLLTGRLDFRQAGVEGDRHRFHVAEGGPGKSIDLIETRERDQAESGAGSIHHVALRVPGDEEQAAVIEELTSAGVGVTAIHDRTYFRSAYFREPGGSLFEIATTGPGFAVDESTDHLGERLMLPPKFEPRRAEIVAALPPLD